MSQLFKFHRKSQQLLLALILEHYGAASEENGGLHLGAFLKELLGMLELEHKVMLIGIRSETYLLDNHLGGVGFHLLRLLLALIEELLVVEYLTNWRIGLGTYLYQVELELICQFQCLCYRIYARLRDILPYQADLLGSDLLVYVQLVLIALLRLTRVRSATGRLEARRLRFVR